MNFRFDAATEKLRDSLLALMDERIYPAEPVFAEQMASLSNRWAWTRTPIMGELRAEVPVTGFPLAAQFSGIRTLRFADGPDEVHKNSLAEPN